MKNFGRVLGKAAALFLTMTVVCGAVYTMAVTGISQVLFHDKANGSIIEIDGVKYGSGLLGQRYEDEAHLWGRIVTADVSTYLDDEGNPLMYAGASNMSPAGAAFQETVAQRVAWVRELNPEAGREDIPVELVTGSGSGLDPDISPAAAEYQVPRIAAARGMSEEAVREIIDRYTKGRLWGILGEKTVNVLKVNLALDGILNESS